MKRWLVVARYADGTVAEHRIEELDELDPLIESGPDWTGMVIEIRHALVDAEQAVALA